MRNTILSQPSTLLQRLASLAGALILTQSAHAIVTAQFTQEGDDVRVSFSGTLDLDPSVADDSSPYTSSSYAGVEPVSTVGLNSTVPNIFQQSLGSNTITTLAPTFTIDNADIVGAFGFGGGNLTWSADLITGGTVDAVSELTVTPASNHFYLRDKTLIGIGANTLTEGQTLWTAGITNDTIIFSTIPEPSSTLLLGLSSLALTRRRRA